MKKLSSVILSIASLALLMAGCGNLQNSQLSSNGGSNSSNKKTASVQTTGQTNNDYYQGIIRNGQYQVSKARGVNVENESNQFDVKSFSTGLLNLSKTEFPTNKYLFQEGQYITTSTAQKWLARQSSSNPDGLNPTDNGQTDPDKRNPIYLQQLLEQDFVTESNNKVNLAGMSIGLGLNSVDTYTKQQYGATYETKISQAADQQQGEQMATKVLARLRKMKGISNNVPIMIALYRQSGPDSLVGGTFFAYAISKSGINLGAWHKIDQQNEVLPVVNNAKPINSNVANAFNTFRSAVKQFFPNLSGVTAQVRYENGSLAGMNITITTQFYSETEITSFAQFVASEAAKDLPSNVPIQINIQSVQGMQAFVARDSGSKSFYTHIFDSY